jgi:hypothetical protein
MAAALSGAATFVGDFLEVVFIRKHEYMYVKEGWFGN